MGLFELLCIVLKVTIQVILHIHLKGKGEIII